MTIDRAKGEHVTDNTPAKYHCQMLEIVTPSKEHINYIHQRLQSPDTFRPLSLSKPPSLEDVSNGQFMLCEEERFGEYQGVEFMILRQRIDDAPVGFLLHYGWDGAFDKIRETDLVLATSGAAATTLYIESLMLSLLHLFGTNIASRVRWRAIPRGPREEKFFAACGAHVIGRNEERDPVEGHFVERIIYEVRAGEFKKELLALDTSFLDPKVGSKLVTQLWRNLGFI